MHKSERSLNSLDGRLPIIYLPADVLVKTYIKAFRASSVEVNVEKTLRRRVKSGRQVNIHMTSGRNQKFIKHSHEPNLDRHLDVTS